MARHALIPVNQDMLDSASSPSVPGRHARRFGVLDAMLLIAIVLGLLMSLIGGGVVLHYSGVTETTYVRNPDKVQVDDQGRAAGGFKPVSNDTSNGSK